MSPPDSSTRPRDLPATATSTPALDTADPARAPGGRRAIVRALLATGGTRLLVLPLTGLANLAIARLITDAVGIEQFGVVMLVATLSQLLIFADLGAGAAVATARAHMTDDAAHTERFRRTLLTAVRTMLCSSVLLALVAVSLWATGAWSPLLGTDGSGMASSVDLAAMVALLAFGAALPFALGEATLRGGGRLHEAVLLNGLAAPAALAMVVLLYLLDAPPMAYAVTIPLGTLVGALSCSARAFRSVRDALRGLAREILRPRRYPGSAIAATAVPMFVVMVGLPIALQSDRIVISHRVDPTSLSDYSYAAQLYMPLWSVVSVAALALWPMFASRRNSGSGLRRAWLTGMALVSGAGLVIAVCFVLCAGLVTDWMSNGTADLGRLLPLSFAGLLLVQAVHVTTGIMLISPVHLRFQAVCVIALVLTNLPLSWYLAPVLGASGPVIASLVTVLFCQLVPGVIVALRATAERREVGDPCPAP